MVQKICHQCLEAAENQRGEYVDDCTRKSWDKYHEIQHQLGILSSWNRRVDGPSGQAGEGYHQGIVIHHRKKGGEVVQPSPLHQRR